MTKKLIRLTEGDLHRIIKASVNKILKENKPNTTDDSFYKFVEGFKSVWCGRGFYNTRRMHYSIGLMTPEEAYQTCGKLERKWKKYPFHKTNKENSINFTSDKKATV